MIDESPNMLSYARSYAKRGLKVFPCYEPFESVCSCGDPDCQNPGKHPRTKNGLKDATTDPVKIREYWTAWPSASIAILTEDMIVVDVDADKGGYVSLEKLETDFGKLPESWRALTGGGGEHDFYRRNGASVINGSDLRPGIDVKTNGGYVIVAPSLHISGKRYQWAPNLPKAPAELPKEWIQFFENAGKSKNGEKPRFDTAGALAGVPEGQRDETCWKLACKLRSSDVPISEALELVAKAAKNCKPAFPEDQAREKVERAYKTYKPNEAVPGSAEVYRNVTAEIREYVNSIEGEFSTQQIYSDLALRDASDKACARKALERLKGSLIEPEGTRAGWYRIIANDCPELDLSGESGEELNLWLPLDLSNYVRIMAGNIIVITGDADSGKTAFLLNVILGNLEKWNCFYFNSEMGKEELKTRLRLFENFPLKHEHFHAFERSDNFADIVRPGKNCLNVIDYLEISENFFLVSKYLNDIHRKLGEGLAVIAIQMRDQTSKLPVGKDRAMEKPRLVIALSRGNKTNPNEAQILKAKNRKTQHSLIGLTRPYKLVQGCKFITELPGWY